jgi:hypothetical protein
MLRIPHCLDSRLIDGGKVLSSTHPPHFTPFQQKRLNTTAVGQSVADVPDDLKSHPTSIHFGKIKSDFNCSREESGYNHDWRED